MLHRELGNPQAVAAACNNAASIAIELGDLDRARDLYREAIELARTERRSSRARPSRSINLADSDRAARATPTRRTASTPRASSCSRSSATSGARRRPRRGWRRARGGGETRVGAGAHTRRRSPPPRRSGIGRRGAVLGGLGDLAAEAATSPRPRLIYREPGHPQRLGDRIGTASVLERLAGCAEDRPRTGRAAHRGGDALREAWAPLSAAAAASVDHSSPGWPAHRRSSAVAAASPKRGAPRWEACLERGAASR